jgi:AcrR family transcriptional regulator
METHGISFEKWLAETKMADGKRRIIQAAVELFAENGFQATSTAAIAKSAGLSDATMFKHFKTKQELLDAIIEPLMNQLVPEFSQEFISDFETNTESIDDVLRFIIRDRWHFMNVNNQILQIVQSQLLVSDSFRAQLTEQLFDKLQHVLLAIQKLLDNTPSVIKGTSSSALIRLVAGQLLVAFIQRYKFGIQIDDNQITEQITSMTIQAIKD